MSSHTRVPGAAAGLCLAGTGPAPGGTTLAATPVHMQYSVWHKVHASYSLFLWACIVATTVLAHLGNCSLAKDSTYWAHNHLHPSPAGFSNFPKPYAHLVHSLFSYWLMIFKSSLLLQEVRKPLTDSLQWLSAFWHSDPKVVRSILDAATIFRWRQTTKTVMCSSMAAHVKELQIV